MILFKLACTWLQRLLDGLAAYCDHWNLAISLPKSFGLTYKNSYRITAEKHRNINSNEIETVRKIKISYIYPPIFDRRIYNHHKQVALEKTWRAMFPLNRFLYAFKEMPATFFKSLYLSASMILSFCMGQKYGVCTYPKQIRKTSDEFSSTQLWDKVARTI